MERKNLEPESDLNERGEVMGKRGLSREDLQRILSAKKQGGDALMEVMEEIWSRPSVQRRASEIDEEAVRGNSSR